MEEDELIEDENIKKSYAGRSVVGVMVKKSTVPYKVYKFVYDGEAIEIDNNILYVMTDIELTDKELRKRFLGTNNIKKIIRQ